MVPVPAMPTRIIPVLAMPTRIIPVLAMPSLAPTVVMTIVPTVIRVGAIAPVAVVEKPRTIPQRRAV
jgi:hypothetical protein